MKILIVESKLKTSEYLLQGLTEAGFVVDSTHSGLDGCGRGTDRDAV
jgi:two-component system copper resistance phosphate regulon response regulator CusR